MIEKYITMPPITVDPICMFFDERKDEQKIYNQQQDIVEDIWKDILYDEKFVAAEFTRSDGETLILHVSPRKDVDWQLSYFDSKGPIMHENYVSDDNYKEESRIGNSMKDLIRNLMLNSLRGQTLKIKVLIDEQEPLAAKLAKFEQQRESYQKNNIIKTINKSEIVK